ncbi:universal stress protein [Acidithiobacillus sp. M4-SHS-6]|uniref:universal stress protein n=1 Tax=Acidithiobacillus sp. M4-SHS-6 TaxID=3383024 RepID=UPI0039BDA685
MFAHILLAADGSAASASAEATAIQLAKEQDAELRIVHVVDIFGQYFATPESIDFLMAAGQEILDHLLARATAAGLRTQTRLRQTDVGGRRVSELILEEAHIWPADLIVIGSHGRRGLDHFLMGSVAESVCQGARTKVLLSR